ncbi:DnaJ C-terminal domain-containing protein [Paraliomyxa miuraensis]|uniref:DnaJ C-terminal domain-containing protein n=1 Tax=Paraliomyxa miuraensis TaxID=376150 RepID=UPI0022571E8C|nr:DnaJ C-terminal domain-containing protein [Paraliomyxa miuraensis]MCX4247406.1 DnaJ domain-containing protein [Paraliomyxa miuraensis]
MRDLYQALGLEPRSSGAEVKKAYRELTRRFHPDLNPGRPWATERYKEVVEAYAVLGDQGKRSLYDEFGEVAFTRGFDAERARRARSQVRPPASATTEDEPGDSGLWSREVMDFADLEAVQRTRFDDFLERLFGRGGNDAGHDEEGLDLRATLTLRASETIAGGTRRVRYPRANGEWTSTEVEIPAGIMAGATMRLPGRGEPGDPPGALLLDIAVEADPGLRLEGNDIHVELDVPLRTLYEGGRVEVVVPFGRFEVKVPPGTAPHKPLRLRAQGLPRGGDERGDLIVALRMVMPPAADPELLAALRRLQR